MNDLSDLPPDKRAGRPHWITTPLGRVLAALSGLVIFGAALFVGLFFATIALVGLILGGIWYRLKSGRSVGGTSANNSHSVIDGEYSVIRRSDPVSREDGEQ